jgi:hypothetical protein
MASDRWVFYAPTAGWRSIEAVAASNAILLFMPGGMLAPCTGDETKEPQPTSASRAKLILAQHGILYSINGDEILVANPCSCGEPEESWVKRGKIDITKLQRISRKRLEYLIVAECVSSLLEMLDFDWLPPAFITRHHVAHFKWTETEWALDFLHRRHGVLGGKRPDYP